jgi:hypothetical protein
LSHNFFATFVYPGNRRISQGMKPCSPRSPRRR